MKYLRLPAALMILIFILLAGCGGGGNGDGLNGDLTVTAAKNDNGNSTSDVSFTITYKNSQVTDYQGLDIAITTTVSPNNIPGFPDIHTDYLTSSGTKILTYTAVPANHTIRLQAVTSGIVSSASTFVAASNLTVAQITLNFTQPETAGDTRTTTISGGTPPYSASSSTGDLAATVSGNTLTVTLNNPNLIPPIPPATTPTPGPAKTGTITVQDSSGKTITVTINY